MLERTRFTLLFSQRTDPSAAARANGGRRLRVIGPKVAVTPQAPEDGRPGPPVTNYDHPHTGGGPRPRAETRRAVGV